MRNPELIAAEVARHRADGGLDKDLAAIDRHLAAIADKRSRVARAIATVDDDEAATPLSAELKALATRKTAATEEREALLRRIADRDADEARVRSLAAWCPRVGANLDTLSYDERRLALEALGVKVQVFAAGARDEAGHSLPHWVIIMQPVGSDDEIRRLTPALASPTMWSRPLDDAITSRETRQWPSRPHYPAATSMTPIFTSANAYAFSARCGPASGEPMHSLRPATT